MKKLIFRIALIIIFTLFAFIWYQQEVMMSSIKEKTAKQQGVYEEILSVNQSLSNDLEGTVTKEFYIEQARTRLGYYRPGEIPVRNISDMN